MRDRRLVAMHRGGTLDPATHRLLAAWAADCAERVLPLFHQQSSDLRPYEAIEKARAWARGEIAVGAAQKAAVAAHAAARAVKNGAAVAAARAAGHAVATAHMADHCLGPCIYGVKAVVAAGGSGELESKWQLKQLPQRLRALIASSLSKRTARSTGAKDRRRQTAPQNRGLKRDVGIRKSKLFRQ
ncbi:MAG: putative immunity protein [Chthoniobacterales bacterium]